MEASNVKELREALERSTRRLEAVLSAFECGEMSKYINADIQDNRAVLAKPAPARNCDVGGFNKQQKRFEHWCDQHPDCEGCIIEKIKKRGDSCELIWAQMHYEAQEEDEE